MDNQESKPLKTGYQVIAEQTLTEEEAAHILGITPDTLAGIRRKNGISYRRIAKSKVLYHVNDITEYLHHGRVSAGFLSEYWENDNFYQLLSVLTKFYSLLSDLIEIKILGNSGVRGLGKN